MSIKKPGATKSALAGTDTLDRGNTNTKLDSLEPFRSDATDQALRTNQGVKVSDNQNTLKVGARGPCTVENRTKTGVFLPGSCRKPALVNTEWFS